MSKQIRVRSAPSNTGPDIHIGNARTILFNHLFARQNNATTVFRIENSDLARSKPEYADAIANTLNWLGLRADEGYKIGGDYGPYTQTEKLARYKKIADELVEKNLAYRCYCTPDELTKLRENLPKDKQNTFRYPGICRDRKEYPNDKKYVIRLKAPTEGYVEWDDLVFKKMKVPNVENYDWVLLRNDGLPLYNFGCAVDDFDQKITHVIRGRDHVVNTPQQILLHRILGSEPITYCHLPMMLGQDKAKLSKRHASVSITDYRDAGYSPSGILNYLLRFGFGFGNKEIFSIDEMLQHFSLEACGKNDGCFDPKKFSSIQFEHLKSPSLTPDKEYAERTLPFLHKLGLKNLTADDVVPAVSIIRNRAKTFVEAANELFPIFSTNNIQLDKEVSDKFINNETKPKLQQFSSLLESITNWSADNIREQTNNWLAKSNLTMKDVGQPIRVAVFGKTQSPELFQVISFLGKENTIERLSKQIMQ